jgi:hypothetical protein
MIRGDGNPLADENSYLSQKKQDVIDQTILVCASTLSLH